MNSVDWHGDPVTKRVYCHLYFRQMPLKNGVYLGNGEGYYGRCRPQQDTMRGDRTGTRPARARRGTRATLSISEDGVVSQRESLSI